mmetsp:Transcript_858/g.1920  ORF Transcript_858/g.1920 Transcript_858/m.1920 type:complete len:338 (+) Transcript_858:38-1051(+)
MNIGCARLFMAVTSTSAGSRAAATASPAKAAIAAHIYLSEGRDETLIKKIASAGSPAGPLVNLFVDAPYHRSGVTLAAASRQALEIGVVAVCAEALKHLDFRVHQASHPRLGIVDHIAVNPLGSASCEEAAMVAQAVGSRLASADYAGVEGAVAGKDLCPAAVPVYLYGHAHPSQRSLASLRRSLAYFKGSAQGSWIGLSPDVVAAMDSMPPDMGPQQAEDKTGITVVGAVPWVHNYNILLQQGKDVDISSEDFFNRCREIARSVSTRWGGLPCVEAMALHHELGIEVACNLLDIAETSPKEVREKVEQEAARQGISVHSDYFTNKLPEQVLDMITK